MKLSSIRSRAKTVYYNSLLIKNLCKKTLSKEIQNKYLFILSPPFCGSTLLSQVISTSGNVSVNNSRGTREGQTLPPVREIMFEHRWVEDLDFDWAFIKKKWLLYWDTTLPVLLEKSPPNLMRARSIERVFSPSYFIIFFRNPYAHIDSLVKRSPLSLKDSAEFAIFCLKHQLKNIQTLNNKLVLSYEDFSNNPHGSAKQIIDFLPEISEMNLDRKFSSHNFLGEKKMRITNLNEKKLSSFTESDLKLINSVFCKEKELLNAFGYCLINP